MAKQPLLVHLLFHPDSEQSRALAQHVHRQLNDDVVVPGLRIPTVFCPVREGQRPPATHRLQIAERSFVVPLADDHLCIDDDWCRFVAEVWVACQDSPHRCVPMQLSENAWPLDQRLEGTNFARAFAHAEVERRHEFVVRRLVIELCRYLLNLDEGDDTSRAPVELFLSHTKLDIDVEPKVTEQVIAYLQADQPIEAWVDSGDIATGSQFAKAIEDGVERTSLLVVLTDNYSTREWCREEVMLAKDHQRPIAVIDALMKYEVRSFPFLDNVPKCRWDGIPQTGVDLLLKETLRHLHTTALLNQSKRPDDLIFVRPPEPATLLGVPAGKNVLYPDPPLGVGELRRLAKSNVEVSTPLQRAAVDRDIEGKLIALSMSESTDIDRCGMDPLHLDQTMLELSRYLLVKGATLAYGGHLGAEGYTHKLFELVRTYNSLEGVEPFDRIVNHRGWPLPKLDVKTKAALKHVAKTIQLSRPVDIDDTQDADFIEEPDYFPGDKSAVHRYAWARGMTEMRTFQADQSKSGIVARVVLGGTFGPTTKVAEDGSKQERWYSSRMPGVLEEVLLSIQVGQPVFLIGAFGGAATFVADLLQGKHRQEATWEYQKEAPFADEMRNLYVSRNQSWWYYDNEPRVDDLTTDCEKPIVEFLAEAWGASKENDWETGINPLTRAQNLELFETVDPARMVDLLLDGLCKL